MDTPRLRCVFLGYLWKVARAIREAPRADLLACGIEPQRMRTSDAIRYFDDARIPHFDAGRPSPPELQALLEGGIDLLVVGAFGRILPVEVFTRARLGTINVHASLLPAYRGGCPIEEQILAGETQGGVTLHWMTEDVDGGPILAAQAFPISSDDAYADVFERCHTYAEALLAEKLREEPSRWPRTPQATTTPVRKPRTMSDDVVNWYAPALDIKRLVQADGWRGWVRTSLPQGDLVMEQVAIADAGDPPTGVAPGRVLVAGDAPVIQTGHGSIRLLKATFPRPLVSGEQLPSGPASS
jgi:methionyl-tRNA formyltransferase